ncbi:hypothetical protein GE09DRAFT_1220806 [Coniochaeta sp. 2T2.1]|nr:hypothetical protein GE09DRAFT_1220806 [Coniochaeta sp. 2T2.1]
MGLTPIKIRGKGPRKAGFRPPNPNKRVKNAECMDCGSTNVYKQDTAAPIEKLPTEILHRIHLFSQEPNFPKASLRIGRLLSHRSFHADLVVQAFAPTWDLWMGAVKAHVNSYHGWFEDSDRFGGDPVLQSKVLALPFMNMSIIQLAMDIWARTCKGQHHYQHSGDWNPSEYYIQEDDEREGFFNGITFTDGVPHKVKHDHLLSATACFMEEWQFTCFDSTGKAGYFQDGKIFGGGLNSRLEVHPKVRIPDRLITGPFTIDDSIFFFWLMHNNAVVADDQSWEASMARKGIASVMDQDNEVLAHVITTFLYAVGAYKNLPSGVPLLSFDQACKKLKRHKDDPPPQHPWYSWKSIIDRLYNFDGTDQEFAIAYMAV